MFPLGLPIHDLLIPGNADPRPNAPPPAAKPLFALSARTKSAALSESPQFTLPSARRSGLDIFGRGLRESAD